jgi:hypothetical protein
MQLPGQLYRHVVEERTSVRRIENSDDRLAILALLPSLCSSAAGTVGQQSPLVSRSGRLQLPCRSHLAECGSGASQRGGLVVAPLAQSVASSFTARTSALLRSTLFSCPTCTGSAACKNDGAWSGMALSECCPGRQRPSKRRPSPGRRSACANIPYLSDLSSTALSTFIIRSFFRLIRVNRIRVRAPRLSARPANSLRPCSLALAFF